MRRLFRNTICSTMFVLLIVTSHVYGCEFCRSAKSQNPPKNSYKGVVLTVEEKKILQDKLKKLIFIMKDEDIAKIQSTMHPDRVNNFTSQHLQAIKNHLGPLRFKIITAGLQKTHNPKIANHRCGKDSSYVEIERFGYPLYFKEKDGVWYFDGA